MTDRPAKMQFLEGARVAQIRLARPTSDLKALVRFYRDDLGLPEIGRFEGHAGYDGVMLGLPGASIHLELTQSEIGEPLPRPAADSLLVLYVPDVSEFNAWKQRMLDRGHKPVSSENPYWDERGVTFEDPDGWRLVLCNTAGIG